MKKLNFEKIIVILVINAAMTIVYGSGGSGGGNLAVHTGTFVNSILFL